MTPTNDSAPVLRTPSSCTSHTIPDIPARLRMASAEYMGGNLYLCGGYNDDDDISGSIGRQGRATLDICLNFCSFFWKTLLSKIIFLDFD